MCCLQVEPQWGYEWHTMIWAQMMCELPKNLTKPFYTDFTICIARHMSKWNEMNNMKITK